MGSTLVTERLIACWWISLFWERNFSDNWFVWLIKKDVLIRELVLIAIFGNVGREKKRHQKILFTLQLTSKFTWTKIMVSVDGLVISQIAGGLSISQCLLSVTFLQLDQVKFSFVRKAFIGQWTVTAEQNQKGLNINRTSFFLSKSYIILIFIDTEFNLYLLNSFKLTYLDNSIDIFNEKYSTIAIWCNSLLINVGVFSILFFLCI